MINASSMSYLIDRYGVVDTAQSEFNDNPIAMMHVAMIKTHEEALEKLLYSLVVDDE